VGAVTEAELRAAVVKLAHQHGWLVFSLPMAKLRRPVKNATGYPDLTLARNGEVLWLELKTERGQLSDDQLRWQRTLPDLRWHVVRPMDYITGFLDTLLR
jgi:hypothetical protein